MWVRQLTNHSPYRPAAGDKLVAMYPRIKHVVPFVQSQFVSLAVLIVFGSVIAFGSAHAQASVPPVVDVTLGTSLQGRPITGLRVGHGSHKLVLIGSVHGGPERNTYQLVSELVDHFRLNPQDVPPNVSLYLIPSFNPDGLALGIRQNANGVDLNRNMDTSADSCPENDWQHTVEGAYGIVSDTGGPYSESEVESRLVRDFLLDADGVIFFHTSGGVVFPACASPASNRLGQIFAAAAGYQFIPKWDRYNITGGMHDWAGGLGIAAITPELATADQPETAVNLAGTRAVLAAADQLFPAPQPRAEGNIPVQPIIWRAWKAWGGKQLFGLPIRPPVKTADGWMQAFERAVLRYTPAKSDTTTVVEVEALGRALLGAAAPATPEQAARFFPGTQQNLSGTFAEFWQINGGLPLFGYPLTGEEQTINSAGQVVIRQVFERAVFERSRTAASTAEITLEPLGRLQWAQQDAQSPETSVWAR